jgi:hypothetical protein
VDTMSWEMFKENESTIVAEVKMIMAVKGKSRKRFRIVALYEKSTGDLIAEVLRTSVGPVVVSRAVEPTLDPVNGAVVIPGFRLSQYHNIDPVTSDDQQFFSMKSRTIWYPLTGTWLRERRYPDDLLVFR